VVSTPYIPITGRGGFRFLEIFFKTVRIYIDFLWINNKYQSIKTSTNSQRSIPLYEQSKDTILDCTNAANTEDEDACESSNYSVDQECLDHLDISLEGDTIVPVASELLPAYLVDLDWRKHHVSLITLTQIAEGSYMLSSFTRQRQATGSPPSRICS
jgi:hypothetical protein